MTPLSRRNFGVRLAVGAAAATPLGLLSGCASSAREVVLPVPGSAAKVLMNAPRHPTVTTLKQCVTRGLAANPAWLNQPILLAEYTNETSERAVSSASPQARFTSQLRTTAVDLGFKPIDLAGFGQGIERAMMTSMIAPRLIIGGALLGWDGLVNSHKQALEVGFAFGGGRGGTTATGGSEDQMSVGKVIATCHIGSDPVTLDARALFGEKDFTQRLRLYRTTTATTTQAEFRLVRRNRRWAGSIVVGIGGGYTTEDTDVNDIQGACLQAVQLSIVLAVAEHFRVTTSVCRVT